jgi:hypothetical protein
MFSDSWIIFTVHTDQISRKLTFLSKSNHHEYHCISFISGSDKGMGIRVRRRSNFAVGLHAV